MTFYHLSSLATRNRAQKIECTPVLWGPLQSTWQPRRTSRTTKPRPRSRQVRIPTGTAQLARAKSACRGQRSRLVQVMETANKIGPTNCVKTTQRDYGDRRIGVGHVAKGAADSA